jgi:biotin operon repressor
MPTDEEILTTSEAVLKVIETAPAQPVSRRFLARIAGTSDRKMRQAVASLREQGHLIVADEGGGYRLAADVRDVQRYTASLRSRIVALARVIKAMETTAQHEFGDFQQLEIDLGL